MVAANMHILSEGRNVAIYLADSAKHLATFRPKNLALINAPASLLSSTQRLGISTFLYSTFR